MSMVRIPNDFIPQLKTICNDVANVVCEENKNGLIDIKLYDAAANSLGFNDYNALLQDSQQYGNGPMYFSTMQYMLIQNLSTLLGTDRALTESILRDSITLVKASWKSSSCV